MAGSTEGKLLKCRPSLAESASKRSVLSAIHEGKQDANFAEEVMMSFLQNGTVIHFNWHGWGMNQAQRFLNQLLYRGALQGTTGILISIMAIAAKQYKMLI